MSEHQGDGHTSADLPTRAGSRPRTTTTNPHTQIDQQPHEPLSETIVSHAAALSDVRLGPSERAPPGAIGFHVAGRSRGPDRAFMLGDEFAHVHPSPDVSLHMTLPEPVRSEAIAKGWAEPHPMAGAPTVSRDIVMVYAPREESELAVVLGLVTRSWEYAADAAVAVNEAGSRRRPESPPSP